MRVALPLAMLMALAALCLIGCPSSDGTDTGAAPTTEENKEAPAAAEEKMGSVTLAVSGMT